MSIFDNSVIKVRNGINMPVIGFGTYCMNERNINEVIPGAIAFGYRSFDTATVYRNEKYLGNVLQDCIGRDGSLSRKDFFITSKLQPSDQGYEKARDAINKSLANLNVSYIDLYLIHWPGCSKTNPNDVKNKELRKGSWLALEEALSEGKLRSIGVSNYLIPHLIEMEEYARVLPMVNQFEIHPAYVQRDLVEYCSRNGIIVQAYSSLARGEILTDSFTSTFPFLTDISEKYKVSYAQIYLKWAVQSGFCIIPKSNTLIRAKENGRIAGFVLTPEEMTLINGISNVVNFKTCWDPSIVI